MRWPQIECVSQINLFSLRLRSSSRLDLLVFAAAAALLPQSISSRSCASGSTGLSKQTEACKSLDSPALIAFYGPTAASSLLYWLHTVDGAAVGEQPAPSPSARPGDPSRAAPMAQPQLVRQNAAICGCFKGKNFSSLIT